ncbi:hypothetical protein Q4I32_002226 [Leishmania shawi]|uniref:C2CD3 N-terminal C2 domain-containing protein n=1 Tax=Leishmania shawi TaxID=5680 RepID=A0AAW3C4Z3_9TRYP
MRVLYGTPLPPGLVAPTRGELRLRVDQLILDNETINHNPLVQLFEAPDSASAVVAAEVDRPEATSASFSRSPNRFVVPVNYCCVGPIFWGETRPSVQGQPATPQLRRGPLTMAYPIKMVATQFEAYLERMTASPQQGVQVDVFVPSSYSGRPPVTVGRCRIALETLQPGHPVKGWFPVMHRRFRSSAEEVAPYTFAEVPVGKVKLTVTVEYFLSSRRPSPEPTVSTKHKRREGKDGGRVPLPHAKTRRSHHHLGRTGKDAAHAPTRTSSTSTETAAPDSSVSSLPTPVANERVRQRGLHRRQVDHQKTALLQDKSSATQHLLQKGLRLRAQMEAATRGLSFDDVDATAEAVPLGDRRVVHGHVSFKDVGDGMFADDMDEDVNDGSAAAYTSEDSDEEKFALQMQKDAEARDRRSVRQLNSTMSSSSHLAPAAAAHHLVRSPAAEPAPETAVEVLPNTNDDRVHSTRAAVELWFSNFSFAHTALTVDLRKIRINVRLSSDITTLEPSSGPLSSFVHPVPMQQPSICLHFDVCSFFEDRSKLVVEAYKVVGELELENENDPWSIEGPRHVAREELLGLSVIGLYRQSRAVVFRDPVADTSNVFAHLEVRVQHHSISHSTTTSTVLDALHQQQPQRQLSWNPTQGAASSSSQTPVSDAVQLSSIPASAVVVRPAKDHAVGAAVQTSPARRSHVPDTLLREAASASPGIYPSRVLQAPVGGHSLSSDVTGRRRLRIVVYSAVELPRVAVAQSHNHSSATGCGESHFPIISARPPSIPEAGVDGATSYAEPNSFVTVEEVYRVEEAWGTKSKTAASTSCDPSAPSSCRQSIHNWYVDEAHGGFYDRSAVAKESSNPDYNYEVILQLPEITVPMDSSISAAAMTHGLADMLDELQLRVWHSDLSRQASVLSDSAAASGCAGDRPGRSRRASARQQEEHFWECAAYMGTCRVDLRPLRYLNRLDGYYRVVCERTPESAVGPSATEVESNTIGYVRLSVSLY